MWSWPAAGDVPTMETLAAVDFLRRYLPDLRIRVVNVVDLMTLQPQSEHPHGLSDREFDSLFTVDRPVIFAYHGYPWLIHRLTYRRTNHGSLHVRGYKEEGTTTTPFDMTVRNELDRFSLVRDVIDRVPGLGQRAAHLRQLVREIHVDHWEYIQEYGDDMPLVKDWTWGSYSGACDGMRPRGAGATPWRPMSLWHAGEGLRPRRSGGVTVSTDKNARLEIIHTAENDPSYNLPYAPAIKVNSGSFCSRRRWPRPPIIITRIGRRNSIICPTIQANRLG